MVAAQVNKAFLFGKVNICKILDKGGLRS